MSENSLITLEEGGAVKMLPWNTDLVVSGDGRGVELLEMWCGGFIL